jgi:hypothetical protein
MGYRSDVTAIVYGPIEKFNALIAKHELLGTSPFGHFKDYLTRGSLPDGSAILELQGEGWKWYESYPDVKCWMAFMYDAEVMGLEYEFIRIGENDDDLERQGSSANSGLLYAVRSVACDYDIAKEDPNV